MRIFPDTNVLVSAFVADGLCYRLVRRILADPAHELIIGALILEETKQKLKEKIKAPDEEIRLFEQGLLAGARLGTLPEHPSSIPIRDLDDAWVLASALAARADVLVTGDKDLLDIRDQVQELAITTPRVLHDMLQTK